MLAAAGAFMTSQQVADRMPAVRQAISCMLKTLCATPQSSGDLERTHAVWIALTEPGIPLLEYAMRLQTYMHCSASCLVLSIIYIDRLIQLGGSIAIHPRTIHRLLLTAMVISAKYWDDEFYKNSYYARVGGLPVVELNKLEADLCFELNFELAVDPRLFSQYYEELAKHTVVSKCPNCNPNAVQQDSPRVSITVTPATEEDDEESETSDDQTMRDDSALASSTRNSLKLTLTPARRPQQRVPGIRTSFGGSICSRNSVEENRAQDELAFRRHSHSFSASFHNSATRSQNLSDRAPPQLMAAAAELMGWDENVN